MIFFDMGIVAQLKVCKGCGFFFFQFTPHPLECLCLREERSTPTYIGPTLAKSQGRQPSPTLAKIRFPQWWMGCFNGFNLRLLGGWVDRFRVVLMGLICVCLVDGLIGSVCWVWLFDGFDFCSHGFDSYGFGFIVLIFSVDGFAGFQEDESWVDRQWVDSFD